MAGRLSITSTCTCWAGASCPGPLADRFESWLAEAGHQISVRRFPEGTRTAEDAARAIGCEVGQIVKSLVFTLDESPVVLLVSGANRVDPARFHGRLAKADADLARAATGYSIGGVPPFGHDQPIPVFMDRDLLDYEVVWAAAGRPDSVFPIAPDELRRLSSAEIKDLK
jgi:prolyl-tRNA editing enzyme YbaK/EbsC (Cys-tRNA(Pro) deacylase)